MKLDREQIEARLEEYQALRPDPGRDELAILEAALFLEEAFGIHVTDAEISRDALGSFGSLRRLLDSKLGNT